jgi:hypothetical protein
MKSFATPIVLPWPVRSGLEAATAALFDLGDQFSVDFLRPAEVAASVQQAFSLHGATNLKQSIVCHVRASARRRAS